MAGRGRAAIFKPKPTSEDPFSTNDNNEPPRPRGRASFLLARQTQQDAQTTVSGTTQSDASSTAESSGVASGSTGDQPKPRGRAAIFSTKSSSSGVYSGELESDVQKLQVTETRSKSPTPRKSPMKERSPPVVKQGISGRPTDVACNYVRLDLLDPNRGIWEYEVIFKPELDNKFLRSKFANIHFLTLGGKVKVFDTGTRLFTPMKTEEEVTKGVYEGRNGEKIEVIFKRKWLKKFSECRSILNIIIKRIMSELNLIRFGRSDFNPKARHMIPQHKLEIWPGCVTVVEDYEGGILLNCDVSHRVLQTGTVLDMIMECRGGGGNFEENVAKTLLGLSVITKYNNRTVRIDDIEFNMNPMSTFEKNGKQITYVEYYQTQYNITIRDRGQPLLMNRAKKKPLGKEAVDILNYYVPELCSPTGLTDAQRGNFKLMKDVAAITQLTPPQRDQSLTKFLQGIHDNEVCSKMLQDWGLRLPVQPVELRARTLDPEKIHFGGTRVVSEANADWGRATSNSHMLSGIDIKKWAVLYTARDLRTANTFFDKVKELAPKIGVRIEKPEFIKVDSDSAIAYCNVIKRLAEMQIVTIIFPSQRDDRYGAVKKLCNVTLGLPSQVVVSRTLQKDPRALGSVVLKIMLQINCKLGGALWGVFIPYKEDGVMFCGIDVYHEGGQRMSSVIALVSTIDKGATRWTSGTTRHNRGQEISDKIIELFRECLQRWYNVNKSYPKRIIIFRDGVGDGQLSTVKEFEIPQFKKIFCNINEEYQPMMTYMIVQKRINTRFYIKSRGKLDNPPPGTVLDHTITRRDWYDFFLVSQNVRQGTVAPTHFIVVEDSSTMTPDQVQKIAYKMTHLYYNWNGTVRVPAPCQYAHKLAYLVGQFVHDEAHIRLKDSLYFL